MDRRHFLGTGIGAAAGGVLSQVAVAATASDPPQGSPSTAPAVLKSYTNEDHRRRLENIRIANRGIRACMRKHLITNYLAGQCTYNLGEYPSLKVWDPDEWDEHELDKLRAHGIELIQVHEEWNDSQRLFGGNKLAPANPAGLRRFVDMVHKRGMRLLVYVSSGFFQRTDPDFRPEWAGPLDLIEIYFDYALCSPASPGWRAYLLPRLMRILDEYGVDGLYNDLGYRQPGVAPAAKDEVLAFEETPKHDGALGDLLALIYAEVKRRRGLVKVHYGATSRPLTELKIYDYLWVGEGAQSGDRVREAAKEHPPYVVPCVDMSRARIGNEDELYLQAIPYMQFPLLLAGRPFTGQRAVIPGIKYPPEQKCFWTRHCRAIWKHYQAHPEGPHSYGWWDSVPGRPAARPTHARWLRQYRPMVEDGTWAWLEVRDSDLFAEPLPRDVVASVFANRRLYLVLANYGQKPVTVRATSPYDLQTPQRGRPTTQWRVDARSLLILQRA